jgi:hypothetical protein
MAVSNPESAVLVVVARMSVPGGPAGVGGATVVGTVVGADVGAAIAAARVVAVAAVVAVAGTLVVVAGPTVGDGGSAAGGRLVTVDAMMDEAVVDWVTTAVGVGLQADNTTAKAKKVVAPWRRIVRIFLSGCQ